MLNRKQQLYFENIVNHVKKKLNISIPILAYDHKKIKGYENTSGLAWFDHDNKLTQITIDIDFICECFKEKNDIARERARKKKMNIFVPDVPCPSDKKLKETICHEIAHNYRMNHCKKHKELTRKFFLEVR